MTTRWVRRGLLIGWVSLVGLGALLLAGCDPQRVAQLEEGVSTEVDVRKQFGDPVTVTVLPDGSRVLDYPRQPEGWTNYVIRIGPDGKMSSLRQLLNDDNFARVQPGMGAQQVRDLLGRPAEQKRYELKNEEVWSWRYKPVNESRLFSVTFGPDGKVSATAKGDDPREQAQSGR
jgi:outer membrane protein assembly factor BamE (lipoprotein component of BamABCDE complex)